MRKYTLKFGATLVDFIAPSQELALAEARRLYPFASFVLHEISDNLKFGSNPMHYVYEEERSPTPEETPMNDFTTELLVFAQKCSAAKTPDAAFVATILNILAASSTEELMEICEKLKDKEEAIAS